MNGVEEFLSLKEEATAWRRYLHQIPELDYRLHETSTFVAEKLASFGITTVETGIAETGIVAVVKGEGGEGPTIALRAEMDGSRLTEKSNRPWSSGKPGLMHASGHDGLTAMLLGAGKVLAADRSFRGTVVLIFQPGGECGLGGKRLVDEGVMDRFAISRVFGMENIVGTEIGRFSICDGPIMAALDEFDIIIKGRGGHAATPHRNIDPVVIAGQIIVGLQPLVSRVTNPQDALVLSITRMEAGETYTIIPETAILSGTVRTLNPQVRDQIERQIPAVARGIANGYGGEIEFRYRRHDPITMNSTEETNLAISAARNLVGSFRVDDNYSPIMESEDFAYMLNVRPGAIIFIGNGTTASLNSPAYDFNDEALPFGIGYWVNLVRTVLPASPH